jgi:hypothetical protein
MGLVLERLGRKLGGLRSCYREEFGNGEGRGSNFGRWRKQSEQLSFVWRKKKQGKGKERKRGDLQAGPARQPIHVSISTQFSALVQQNHYVKSFRGLFNRFCNGFVVEGSCS